MGYPLSMGIPAFRVITYRSIALVNRINTNRVTRVVGDPTLRCSSMQSLELLVTAELPDDLVTGDQQSSMNPAQPADHAPLDHLSQVGRTDSQGLDSLGSGENRRQRLDIGVERADCLLQRGEVEGRRE